MKKRVRIYKPQGSMPNVQLNKPGRSLKRAQAGIETTDNVIHSRYDDRYSEYDKLFESY